MRPRVAFIDYFPTHYRRRLYEELARRMEMDFYFYADERERYWNRKIPLAREGDYRRVELFRTRILGEAVMPGIARTLGSNRYDAVIKSLNGRLMLPLVWTTSRVRDVPFVLWTGMWHHPETRFHRLSRPLTEGLYRRASAIVAYGEHVKRFVGQTPGVDDEKVFVAGQAVAPEPFTAVQPSLDGEVAEILFVGQFESRKGLTDLLDAFDQLGDLPARLRLVGNGSMEEFVAAKARAREDVELVGYVAQGEIPDELRRARCLVLPSITTDIDKEPWGLVVNEAMHAGVPVVTTDAVGAAAGGLVEDGRNGFVVPERNPHALAGALRRLVADPQTAATFGERARQDVERFDYVGMADAFEAAVGLAIGRQLGPTEDRSGESRGDAVPPPSTI